MKSRFIPLIIFLLAIVLVCPGFAGQTNKLDSQPDGPGAATITALALDAVAAQPASIRPTDWSVAVADVLAGYRPYTDWPSAKRWFMLTQFEKESQKTPAIGAWLHQDHPLQRAQMRFEVQSMIGVGGQFGNVSQEVWDGGPLTNEKLGQFIGNLSSAQKTKLVTNNLRLPISDMTPAQIEVISSIFQSMLSVNGTTVMNMSDAYLYFRFQFYVNAKTQGNSEIFETLVGSL